MSRLTLIAVPAALLLSVMTAGQALGQSTASTPKQEPAADPAPQASPIPDYLAVARMKLDGEGNVLSVQFFDESIVEMPMLDVAGGGLTNIDVTGMAPVGMNLLILRLRNPDHLMYCKHYPPTCSCIRKEALEGPLDPFEVEFDREGGLVAAIYADGSREVPGPTLIEEPIENVDFLVHRTYTVVEIEDRETAERRRGILTGP